jgi:hypothetical protein
VVARSLTIAGAFLALSIAAACSGTALAADGPQWPNLAGEGPQWPDLSRKPLRYYTPPPRVSSIQGEFGARYWFSSVKESKDLYNIAGTALVSRLTYDGMYGHSAEAFGRADHTSGIYLKGYFGGGILIDGKLNDEDFPPAVSPYSSTTSEQKAGSLYYGSIDGGFNLVRQPGLRVGAVAGYHIFSERVNAYGCEQVASNSSVCGGNGISYDVRVISQNNVWHSFRVGLDADIRLNDWLMLRLDAAYLPYVRLDGADSHWLRIGTTTGSFRGSIPEDGRGHGYQLDAALAYALSKDVSLAVGGRYWRMETSGNTHFEGNVVNQTAYPQPVDWKTEVFGVYVQGSFKFGPYVAGAPY